VSWIRIENFSFPSRKRTQRKMIYTKIYCKACGWWSVTRLKGAIKSMKKCPGCEKKLIH